MSTMGEKEMIKAISAFCKRNRERTNANILASQKAYFEMRYWKSIVKEIYPNDMDKFYKLLEQKLVENGFNNSQTAPTDSGDEK